MLAMGRQIVADPDDEKSILSTIRDALHPAISISVADDDLHSIDTFLNRITAVHNNLVRQSHMPNAKFIEIPPLKGNRDDIIKQRQAAQVNRGQFRGRSAFRSSYHGPRGYNNSQHRRYDNESQRSQPEHQNSSNSRSFEQGNFRERGNLSNSHASSSQQHSHDNQRNANSRSESNRGRGRGRTPMDMSTIKCHKCGRFGHIGRNCPDNSVSLGMYAHQPNSSNFHNSQQNPFHNPNYSQNPFNPPQQQQSDNPFTPQHIHQPLPRQLNHYTNSSVHNQQQSSLNYQGRNHDTSNRGNSQF
jgi:hypothetical protein